MDQQVIDDLKQFITATVSQQVSGVATKDDVVASEKRIGDQIKDLQASVSEALEVGNDAVDEQLKDHETRITSLGQRPASA